MAHPAEGDVQEFIRRSLRTYLADLQKKNSKYSLRALALKLELQATNLSAFLNGKRRLSKQSLEIVTRKIFSNPEERKYVLAKINALAVARRRTKTEALSVLDDTSALTEAEFLQLGDWYFYAIRTFLSLKSGPRTLDALAETLKLPLTKVHKALNTLLSLGLIQRAGDGTFFRTHKHIATPDTERRSPEIHVLQRRIHHQHIERALVSLHNDDPSVRDITWVNIPSDPQKLPLAREIIRKFQDDMILLLETGETTTPYRLTVQLVPIAPSGS